MTPQKDAVEPLVEDCLRAGAHLSAQQLSALTGARWRVSISGVEALEIARVASFLRHDPMPHVAVRLKCEKPLALHYILFFPDWSVAPLVSAAGRMLHCAQPQPQRKRLIIGELANILGNGFVKALANRVGQTLILSVPQFARGSKTELFSKFLGPHGRDMTLLTTQMEMYSDDIRAIGTTLVMLDMPALRGLLA